MGTRTAGLLRPGAGALRSPRLTGTASTHVAVAGLAFGMLLVLGLYGAGWIPRAWRLSTFAFLALAAAALIARRQIQLGRVERVLLCALAGFAAWTAISASWSAQPTTSLLQGERAVVYVVGVGALLVIATQTSVPYLLAGSLAGVAGTSAYGLAKYVLVGHPLDPIQGDLLFEPVGYANGMGIYAALGIVLAIGLALAAPRRKLRIAAVAPLAVLVPTLYLTSSRGAWLALAAGLLAMLGFGYRRAPILAGLIAILVAGALLGMVLASSERGIASTLAGENRPHYWHVAWRQYTENPFLGSGAGTFSDYWLRYRPVDSFARSAHSLYLETLAELGPGGLVLLLAALALPLLAVRRRRDPIVATAAGGYLAVIIHAGIDWDWQLPAVMLGGLFCGAAMVVAARPEDAPSLATRTRVILVVGAVALGSLALVRLETGPTLPFAP